MKKYFLLTFDLEEFVAPLEFGLYISDDEMFSISYKGCLNVLKILDKFKINVTFFVTEGIGKRFPDLINEIVKKDHEIALHRISKKNNSVKINILNHKKILEDITNLKIAGFRNHRFQNPPFNLLKMMNFKYDSSIHPIFIPGRYNYIRYPLEPYKIKGIIEIPISVVPIIRLPFSFLWFRNFDLSYVESCTLMCNLNQDMINMYFHTWEFADVSKYSLPFLIKRNCGEVMNKKMKDFLNWCLTKDFQFSTIYNYIKLLN